MAGPPGSDVDFKVIGPDGTTFSKNSLATVATYQDFTPSNVSPTQIHGPKMLTINDHYIVGKYTIETVLQTSAPVTNPVFAFINVASALPSDPTRQTLIGPGALSFQMDDVNPIATQTVNADPTAPAQPVAPAGAPKASAALRANSKHVFPPPTPTSHFVSAVQGMRAQATGVQPSVMQPAGGKKH